MSTNASPFATFLPASSLPQKPLPRKQVSAFRYPVTLPPLPEVPLLTDEPPKIEFTEEELKARLSQERAAGAAEATARLKREYEDRANLQAGAVLNAVEKFAEESKQYYARVEIDVVSLALSIAAKILHRESQVDPQLVAALVQMALKQMKEGSAVQVRVRPEEAAWWREHFAAAQLHVNATVVEDSTLQPKDCVLETELGKANLGLDAQLKEVERGFFDVLAKKPQG